MLFPVFMVFYGLAQAFVWHVLVVGLNLSLSGRISVGTAIFCLGLAPFLARRLDRRGLERWGKAFSWAGYTWAGLVLLFVMARLAADFVMKVAFMATGGVPSPAARPLSLALTVGLTALLAIYAFIERSRIRVETIDIPTSKDIGIPGGLLIAQISDVHIGSMNGRRRIDALVKKLRDQNPDVVVSTGDLIDSRAGLAVPATDTLSALQPRLGKFAIVGNHEYYAGLVPALAFMERSGFTVLRNSVVTIAGLQIAGVDDPAAARPGESAQNEARVLRTLSDRAFTILLKHRPEVLPGAETRIDLQLSGHTHKGQIFPLGLLTRLYYPAHAGLFRLTPTSHLYVSRGTGAWGPPFRLAAPPEITLFRIGPGYPDPGGRPVPTITSHAKTARQTPSSPSVAAFGDRPS
ncbi:metallophosphoesterase [Acidiferrobacter sp.]|uniref:metallophosphoesterase n=1 Tax=Acidiferrobacter sp. TaxID=1872107 RepID=UPI002614DC61|nr:metallophosphoesterase [Acidiferrobacter sp.]